MRSVCDHGKIPDTGGNLALGATVLVVVGVVDVVVGGGVATIGATASSTTPGWNGATSPPPPPPGPPSSIPIANIPAGPVEFPPTVPSPATNKGQVTVSLVVLTVHGLPLVLLQFKLDIESDYEVVGVTKEWEIMRYNNIQDYRNITLLGSCEKCQSIYPFQLNTYDFFGLSYTTKMNRDGGLDFDSFHRVKCSKCFEPDSLTLIPYWWSSNNIEGIKGFTKEQIRYTLRHKARSSSG